MKLETVRPRSGSAYWAALRLRLLPAGVIILLSILLVSGLASADIILENSAVLRYDGGSVTSNAVRVTVSQPGSAGVSLAPTAATLPGAAGQTLYFPATVTNTGNAAGSFSVSLASQHGWSRNVYRDDNSDGIHQSTEQTVISSISNLAAGAAYRLFAAVTLPAGTADGTQDALTLTVTDTGNSTVSANASYTAQVQSGSPSPGVSVSPTSATMSNVPTQTIYFPFAVTNTRGATDSFSLSINSQSGWPRNIHVDSNGDGIHQSTEGTTTSTGSMATGATLRFFAAVNIPAGTAGGTQDTVTVKAACSSDASVSATVNYTAQVQGSQSSARVTISPTSQQLTGSAGQTLYFPAAITNSGTASDTISLSVASQHGWATIFYRDDNGDGIHQSTENVAATSTGALVAGATFRCFTALGVPAGTSGGTLEAVTVTARSGVDSTVSATASYTAQVAVSQTSGVSISPTSATMSNVPNQTIYFPFAVTNTGGASDSFSLSINSQLGWPRNIHVDSNGDGIHQSTEGTTSSTGSMAPGATLRFFAAVNIPAGTAGGTQDTVTVKATSGANASVSATVNYTAQVAGSQTPGVYISPTSATLSNVPTQTIYFPFAVINNTGATDTFTLSINSQLGWPRNIHLDSNGDGIHQSTEGTTTSTGSMAPGATRRFFAAVNIPAGTASGTRDTVTVKAVSRVNSKLAATVNYTATVATAGSYSMQAEMSSSSVTLSPTEALVSTSPGSTTYISATVTNHGRSRDTIGLAANGNAGWVTAIVADTNQDGIHQVSEITRISSTGALSPGQSKRFFVQVQMPANASASAQETVHLAATSALDATQSAHGFYALAGQASLGTDLDGDGKITTQDVRAVAEIAMGGGAWSDAQRAQADVNRDGVVNLLDVLSTTAATKSVQAVRGNSYRQLSLPESSAPAGFPRSIGLSVDNGAQVAGIEATVLLDTNLLKVQQVVPGQLMGTDPNWQILYSIAEGRVHVLAYNAAGQTLAQGAGSALKIESEVAVEAQVGQQSPLSWAEALVADAAGSAFASVQTTEGSFTVEAPAALQVQVAAEANGAPLAGAQVEAWLDGDPVGSATADASGQCLISGLASGTYELHVLATGFYGETMTEVPVVGGETAEASLQLTQVTKANTGAIEGLIIDSAGQPLNRVQVNIYRSGRRVAYTYTNAEGYYRVLSLAPGDYTVTTALRGYLKGTLAVKVSADEMAFCDLVLTKSAR